MDDNSNCLFTNISFSRYPNTKLLEIYVVRQLASLLPVSEFGVIVNAVNPGLCYSELDRNVGTMPKLGIAVLRGLLARTAEEGSRNLLQAAFAGPESHGAYCSECQVKEYALPSLFPHATFLHPTFPLALFSGIGRPKDAVSGSGYVPHLHIHELITRLIGVMSQLG
jgi:hypothetical protein